MYSKKSSKIYSNFKTVNNQHLNQSFSTNNPQKIVYTNFACSQYWKVWRKINNLLKLIIFQFITHTRNNRNRRKGYWRKKKIKYNWLWCSHLKKGTNINNHKIKKNAFMIPYHDTYISTISVLFNKKLTCPSSSISFLSINSGNKSINPVHVYIIIHMNSIRMCVLSVHICVCMWNFCLSYNFTVFLFRTRVLYTQQSTVFSH